MTGPLALDLFFTSTRKNPAAIHRMAKWTLDALEPACADRPGDRLPSLYRNDRQVKLLHVSMRQNWTADAETAASREPSTFIHAQPLRDVVEDMRIAVQLGSDDEDDGDYPPLDFHDLWDTDRPVPATDPAAARVQAFLADWNRFGHAEQTQTNLLISMDRYVDNALASAPYHVAGTRRPSLPGRQQHLADLNDQIGQWEDERWNSLLSFPLALPLPGLPESSHERETFREALRLSLEEFRQRWPSLRTLVVPIKVTLIVVPPRQGKDLDNLALDVLPAVHDILRPHVEPRLTSPVFTHFNDGADEVLQRERGSWLKRLKSINQQSVTAYQVIELNRMPHHPPGGFLRLTLGLGDGLHHTTNSPWKRADKRMWRHFHSP